MIEKIFKLMEEVSIYWTAAFFSIEKIKLKDISTFSNNAHGKYDVLIPFLPYKSSFVEFMLTAAERKIKFKISPAGTLKIKFLKMSLGKNELIKIWEKYRDSLNKELNDNKRENKNY